MQKRTDADVDHVGDGLAGPALPLARADRVGELLHLLQDLVHGGHHVLAVDHDRAVGAIAQRDVQHRPVVAVVATGEVSLRVATQ